MSYCRWSSDNFRSDVYVYEACGGGWTTHVAGSRHIGDTPIPEIPANWHQLPAEEFGAAYRAQMDWLDKARTEPIGLAHDGESFNDPTPGACADRLEGLRAAGYCVPQFAIDALRAEAAEQEPTHG